VDDVSLTPRAAHRLQRAAQAAQELSETLWEALRDELSDPRPERVVELSECLVAVTGAVTTLACGDHGRAAEPASVSATHPDFPPPDAAAAAPRTGHTAVLVDELDDGEVEAYSARARWRTPSGVEGLP